MDIAEVTENDRASDVRDRFVVVAQMGFGTVATCQPRNVDYLNGLVDNTA
jgi:hypothetical protein